MEVPNGEFQQEAQRPSLLQPHSLDASGHSAGKQLRILSLGASARHSLSPSTESDLPRDARSLCFPFSVLLVGTVPALCLHYHTMEHGMDFLHLNQKLLAGGRALAQPVATQPLSLVQRKGWFKYHCCQTRNYSNGAAVSHYL